MMTIATEAERLMLDLINAERAKVGADPLLLEQSLNTAADDHSAWMLETDVFSHTGVNGSSATDRIADAGFDLSGSWATAENIAVQSERGAQGILDDVADLHISLMNSPGHRANILNPDLDYVGIGIARGDFDFGSGEWDSVIVTQNFGSTGGQVTLDTGNPPAPVIPPVPDDTPAEDTPSAEITPPSTPDTTEAANPPDAAPEFTTPDTPLMDDTDNADAFAFFGQVMAELLDIWCANLCDRDTAPMADTLAAYSGDLLEPFDTCGASADFFV